MGLERFFGLEGKVALVTGASYVSMIQFHEVLKKARASDELIDEAKSYVEGGYATNLGTAIAEAMAEAGADVVICARNREGLTETRKRKP